jgi:diaminopimelate epimerase
VAGVPFQGTAVDVGNPHLVCMLDDPDALDALDLSRSPAYDAAHFPNGANVEFLVPAAPVDGTDVSVRMRVFERGSTETLSCGSGACAVGAVALHAAGRERGTAAVRVPGGELTVTLTADTCVLTGPAVVVATGDTDLI